MKQIDRSSMAELVDRVARIPADARPEWGSMTPAQLVGHFTAILRYVAGEGPELDFVGDENIRNVIAPQIIEGRMPLLRNVQLRDRDGKPIPIPEASIDSLKSALTHYIERLEAGNLPSRIHPFFGLLTPEQWSKLQAVHAEHHLKQFGA